MNATTETTRFNASTVSAHTDDADIPQQLDASENAFFQGLIQRARFYEQFEDRRTKLTYSVIQADISAFTA